MKKLVLLSISLIISLTIFSQEYIFKFKVNSKEELKKLTTIISIDNYKNGEVIAYANDKEFEEFSKLGYSYEILPHPAEGKVINMATTIAQMADWDRYPTYDVYIQMMNKFATDYPDLCQVIQIGTSIEGRQLLALKISDHVTQHEAEPEFLYTSSIHGDELTAFVLLLRLADWLLINYGVESDATYLVDNFEIYINPASNPDGTYAGGNTTVASATRGNANYVDLNRDFPDPRIGPNSPYQQETQLMMDFADDYHFVMSMNFHGGAEVYNYPWDTWESSQNTHADDNWFEHIGLNWVASARVLNSSYMTDVVSSGVTEGGDWYVITGGRQDYMTYYQHDREVTLEISSTKLISSDLLPTFWNYNKQSLIDYLKEAHYGIFGTVKNSNGDPLDAKIEILSHDEDNSWVVTDPVHGDYYRPVAPGTYQVTYSCSGYTSQNHTITVSDWNEFKIKDVILDGVAEITNYIGTITDANTNFPIENAEINLTGENDTYNLTTDAAGQFSVIGITSGTYKISISKIGYISQIHFENISPDNNIFVTELIPYISVSGSVTEDGTGNPLGGVKIEFLGTTIPPVFTNIDGTYSISNVYEGTHQIKASKNGYTSETQTVNVSVSNHVFDFTLAISNAISFESDIPEIFTFGGNADWFRTNTAAYDGDYSVRSGNIGNNGNSDMFVELNILTAGNITFYKKVSSESGYDYLRFYIDGVEKGEWSGNIDWSIQSYPVTIGNHIFKWEYSKDGSQVSGSDCAWVDYIEFPQYQQPATYTVTFNVSDGVNLLESANVLFNSQNINTNASGQAVFTEVSPGNNLPWTVSKTGYVTETGNLTVSNDNYNQNVTLSIVTYTVTFIISDGTEPIQEANIFFNSENKLTDNNGYAVFNNITPGMGLPYSVSKEGFNTFNGQLNVTNQNVEQNINLTASVSVDVLLTFDGMNISPNPTSDFVKIEFFIPEKTNINLSIYDYNGKLIDILSTSEFERGNHTILWNSSDSRNKFIGSGIFFCKLLYGGNTITKKIILIK